MGGKIVVAEDNPQIARLVTFKLEREGFEPVWARDGEEALALIREHRPDLVVMDVMMPMMDGFEVLQALKMDECCRSIPVIMLTARAQEQDVLQGFGLGAEDYMVKPFRPAELVARIQKILNRG